MSKEYPFSAVPAFAGFLAQMERVLFWLSLSDGIDQIAIETEDDVVLELQKDRDKPYERVFEQLKFSATALSAFTDKSEDLWKTLGNWAVQIKSGIIDPSKSRFALVTNKKVGSKSLALKLAQAHSTTDAEAHALVLNSLLDSAPKLRKGLQKHGERVLGLDGKQLASLIDGIHVIHGSILKDSTGLRRTLRNNLNIPTSIPAESVMDDLRGFVCGRVLDCWREGKAGVVSVDAFREKLAQVFKVYAEAPFVERATGELAVSEADVKRNAQRLYVRQLRSIGCERTEILEAILAFERAESEKDRFAREFAVYHQDFQNYYEDLERKWQLISRPKFKKSHPSAEERGYEVYNKTLEYRGRLLGIEPTQAYTSEGAYQYLANLPTIGWHPEWKDIVKDD